MKKLLTITLVSLLVIFALGLIGASRVLSQDASQPTPTPTLEEDIRVPNTLHPTFLPDGRIGYVSDATGYFQIYVTEKDLSRPQRLIKFPGNMLNPTWSHDGTKVLFTSERTGQFVIYLMDADGSGVPSPILIGSRPSWSPDDKQIAYMNTVSRNQDIFVADADGTHIRQITENNFDDISPIWSPDGTMLAYTRKASDTEPGTEIFETPVSDSTAELQVTNLEMFIFQIRWSPDGKSIIFAGGKPNSLMNIFILDSDQTLHQVTDDHNDNQSPDWSPDGKMIVYTSHFWSQLNTVLVTEAGF